MWELESMLIKCQGWRLTHWNVVLLFSSREFSALNPGSEALSLASKLLTGGGGMLRAGARGWAPTLPSLT